MQSLLRREVGSRTVVVVATERADGDMRPDRLGSDRDRAGLTERQSRLTGRPWIMLDEVHGIDVFRTGVHETGSRAQATVGVGDVVVSTTPGEHLAIWAADCAPVVLIGSSTIVALHGGWKGLAAGVLDVGLDQIDGAGDHVEAAVLGPVIHPCCYEFGAAELSQVASGVGADSASIAGIRADGASSLDVPAAVAAGLARRGVGLDVVGPCTGCDERWFSHRVRRDEGRHAVVAWTEPTSPT